MFKIFAWVDRAGHWCGQKLVDVRAIPRLRESLGMVPTFATVQTYNEDGDVLFCPLYADFDCKQDPSRAMADARYVVYLLGEMSNVVPDIYYSGGKGFHLLIPYRVEHGSGHLVAKNFFQSLASTLPTLDPSVYRTQALLRLPNSPGSRPGKWKIQLTRHELMTLSMPEIEELGSRPRQPFNEFDAAKINDEFLSYVEAAKMAVPKFQPASLSGGTDEPVTPCIERLFLTPPDVGQRNHVVMLLARSFRLRGISEGDAVSAMLALPHWEELEREERGMVRKTFRSVYQSRRPSMVGCKTGFSADLMRQFCDPFCWFNEKPQEFRIGKRVG